ncbi:hypothetical protein BH20ACT2_BH20ACT2_08090 [soil metagenome]
MSEQSQGPGWWQASDGRWYPPELAPPGYVEPTQPHPRPTDFAPYQAVHLPDGAPGGPPPGGSREGAGRNKVLGVLGALVVLIALIVGAVVLLGDDDEEATDDSSTTSEPSTDDPVVTEPGEGELEAPEVPEGFRLVEGSDGDWAVGIPEGWQDADLASEDLDAIQNSLGANNPQLSEQIEASKAVLEDSGVLFALAPPDPATGVSSDNLNIIRLPFTGGGELPPGLEVQTRSQLETIGVQDATFETVELRAGEALRGDYILPVNAPDGSVIYLRTVRFFLAAPESAWVLSFSSTDGDSEELVTAVADSFRAL